MYLLLTEQESLLISRSNVARVGNVVNTTLERIGGFTTRKDKVKIDILRREVEIKGHFGRNIQVLVLTCEVKISKRQELQTYS